MLFYPMPEGGCLGPFGYRERERACWLGSTCRYGGVRYEEDKVPSNSPIRFKGPRWKRREKERRKAPACSKPDRRTVIGCYTRLFLYARLFQPARSLTTAFLGLWAGEHWYHPYPGLSQHSAANTAEIQLPGYKSVESRIRVEDDSFWGQAGASVSIKKRSYLEMTLKPVEYSAGSTEADGPPYAEDVKITGP